MDQNKIAAIVESANTALVEKDMTLEDVEAVIQSLIRHFMDNLTDIADIDYFQDRLNDMIDKYVDTHFEDAFDESLN